MNIKRICQFLLDREHGKEDAKLRLRVKWNNSKNIVAFNVGYRVDVEKWSVETQRCKNNTTHGKKKVPANIINREIQRYENAAAETFEEFEKSKTVPDTDGFRSVFNRIVGKADGPETVSLFEAWDEYMEKTGILHSWTVKTYTRQKNIKTHLFSFNPNLSFENLSENMLNDFVRYQQDMLIRNTTLERNISYIKSFLRWSKRAGYYNGNLPDTFKPKLKKADREIVYLSWDELMLLYNFTFEQKYLEHVRDVFCFCCFTSLRHSDVYKLKRSDVKDDHISVVTKKTVSGLKIELNKYSRAILNKYKDTEFPNDRALPVISNQKMNDYLKEMGKTVGFDEQTGTVYFIGSQRYERVYPKYELLSTHCGRRTFVVNSLYLGIPAEVVMSWTGHSDYNAMKPYIKIVDRLKQMSMRKFDEA
ncbi:MAG: site-specific integrase [Prevotellaceae bacterium]|jgi:integrase|nr:site-specific integrase [Prevotellaceae bacterium]